VGFPKENITKKLYFDITFNYIYQDNIVRLKFRGDKMDRKEKNMNLITTISKPSQAKPSQAKPSISL
jgi:hypothetical protein